MAVTVEEVAITSLRPISPEGGPGPAARSAPAARPTTGWLRPARTLRLGVGLVAVATYAGPCGAAPVLPPDIASNFESYLDGFGEPALWPSAALQGYRTRIRMTIRGAWPASATIRIDQQASGAINGHITFLNFKGRAESNRVERDFPVTPRQWLRFEAAARSARLWTARPQFWFMPEGICVAGFVLIFERADADGYRFTTANAQCNAPDAMRDVAEKLIRIAGASQMRGWVG